VAPLVVVAALLVTDRVLVRVAEHRLTGRLGCAGALDGARSVHIGGFPFLTQLAAGHFRTVTATADGIGATGRLTDVAVGFRDVRMPVRAVLLGRWRPGSLTVGSVSATAVLRLGTDAPTGGTARSTGAPPGAVLPPGAHLDTVQPVPGGLRIAVTIPGGVPAAAGGRLCRG
jgi:hypothetical protein